MDDADSDTDADTDDDTDDTDTDPPVDTDDTDTDSGTVPIECRLATSSSVQLSDGNGLFVYTFTYDAAGLLLQVQREYDPIDGVIDALTTFTYNATGQALTEEFDDGNDGTVDGRKSWTYDAAGLPLALEVDTDADGVIETTFTYTHDAGGVLVTERFTTTFAFLPDWEDALLYDLGMLVRRERDTLIDGSIDEVTDYVHDLYGVAVLEATTDPDDGSALRTITRTTDGAGNVLTRIAENFVDGTMTLWTYTYDALGNLATLQRDRDGDGTTATLTTYTWDCS